MTLVAMSILVTGAWYAPVIQLGVLFAAFVASFVAAAFVKLIADTIKVKVNKIVAFAAIYVARMIASVGLILWLAPAEFALSLAMYDAAAFTAWNVVIWVISKRNAEKRAAA